MEYTEKIYSICCHLNENPQGYDTDVIPLVCRKHGSDEYYSIEEHRAKQIVHLILWRIERMSRLFSECLRHDPREESKRAMKQEFKLNLDGSFKLFEALTPITRAKNFLGNKPGKFLMTMFPNYGKSRFEVACAPILRWNIRATPAEKQHCSQRTLDRLSEIQYRSSRTQARW